MKILISTLMVLLSGTVFANEDGSSQDHAGEEEHLPHTLALFAGVTLEHGEYLDTLGLEYSYRVNQNWTVGGVIERADREKNSTLAIAFAHYWPYKGLFLGAGIGRKDPGNDRENTFRATIGYEFVFKGGWVLAPQANIDFIKDHDSEEVYGIAFGKLF
jgi:hypothetical protein